MSERDRRALIILAVAGILMLGYWWFSRDDSSIRVVSASVSNIPAANQRLARLKQLAATVPGKEQILRQVSNELAIREAGLIKADTAAQAQAQLLQILRRLAKNQPAPIELRNTEIGQVKPYGDRYGEVFVSINFESGIEQLINFMSALTEQKELLATTDIHIGAANAKQKTMPVRLTVSGLVRRQLIPEKKGSAL